MDGDLHSLLRQLQRNSSTNAARASGDQGVFRIGGHINLLIEQGLRAVSQPIGLRLSRGIRPEALSRLAPYSTQIGTSSMLDGDPHARGGIVAHNKVEVENDEVRVVHFHYGPGEKSPMHSHPRNVVVWLTDSKFKGTTADGKSGEMQGKAGSVVWRDATVHMVENLGTAPSEGLIIEMKTPAPKAKAAKAKK
jgi:quercetin dioxygenase-like cupin family protein